MYHLGRPAASVSQACESVAGRVRQHYCRSRGPRVSGGSSPSSVHSRKGATMDGRDPGRTDVPARLDRLPWSRFHVLVIAALGITWILDGLEVTLAGSVAAALQESPRLHLSAQRVGLPGSAYLAAPLPGPP